MGAPSARIYELSRRWVKIDAEVTVITGSPPHPMGIIPPEYRGKSFMRESREGISVIRIYVYATANKEFFKCVLSYMFFMFSSIIQGAFKSGRQDIIIATSPQFFVGIAGYVISRIKRIPFIFEVRDLWPESIIQLGLLKNKLLIKILKSIEMFLYRNAVHIVGVDDSTVKILTERGIPAEKISIIKYGVDLQFFDSSIDGLELKNNLLKQAEELKLDNILFFNQILKEELPHYYATSDVILVTLRNLPLFRSAIPSKIFAIQGKLESDKIPEFYTVFSKKQLTNNEVLACVSY